MQDSPAKRPRESPRGSPGELVILMNFVCKMIGFVFKMVDFVVKNDGFGASRGDERLVRR